MNEKGEFTNLETKLVFKWFSNKIEELVTENEHLNSMDLISLVSETIEHEVSEELAFTTEGYISEIIHNSFKEIDYVSLIQYFK